jgi:hypothetical protein
MTRPRQSVSEDPVQRMAALKKKVVRYRNGLVLAVLMLCAIVVLGATGDDDPERTDFRISPPLISLVRGVATEEGVVPFIISITDLDSVWNFATMDTLSHPPEEYRKPKYYSVDLYSAEKASAE